MSDMMCRILAVAHASLKPEARKTQYRVLTGDFQAFFWRFLRLDFEEVSEGSLCYDRESRERLMFCGLEVLTFGIM